MSSSSYRYTPVDPLRKTIRPPHDRPPKAEEKHPKRLYHAIIMVLS
jgi:hypothetical protein